MFKNKISDTILKTFVTSESWLQSTHPLSAAATIAFSRLAIHCVEAGNFDETSDIVGCADIQAVQYNPSSWRPITLYKATYLKSLWENIDQMDCGTVGISVEDKLTLLHRVLSNMSALDAINFESMRAFLASRVPQSEWKTWAERMFSLLYDINADMNNVPGVDQDGVLRLERYEYWPGWLLAFAFELAELANKPG